MKDLKELIEESGLSLDEISMKSGISKKYLDKLINGTAKCSKISHAFLLSKALKLDIATVMYAILKSANYRFKG